MAICTSSGSNLLVGRVCLCCLLKPWLEGWLPPLERCGGDGTLITARLMQDLDFWITSGAIEFGAVLNVFALRCPGNADTCEWVSVELGTFLQLPFAPRP